MLCETTFLMVLSLVCVLTAFMCFHHFVLNSHLSWAPLVCATPKNDVYCLLAAYMFLLNFFCLH